MERPGDSDGTGLQVEDQSSVVGGGDAQNAYEMAHSFNPQLFHPITDLGSSTGIEEMTMQTYSLKKTNHKSAFVISKYEVSGDDLTIYRLQDEKGIKNRLGDSYSSADLFQEISKAQWSRFVTYKRIR